MVDASTVAVAAKWITSSLIEEGQYLYGVEGLVRDLHADLECMLELLLKVDANPNLVKEDGQLRIFTHKIRELAFRAEDAIDTYVVDVGAKVYMKSFFFKLACLVSHSYPLHVLRKEIEAIQQEIQDAKKRFETFGMIIQQPHNVASSQHQGNYNIGSSSSAYENYVHLDDEVVVGIDDVIIKLVERLIDLDDDFRVLGVVGTRGAGKSTLATQLYRHSKVASWFQCKAFVSVSQQWSRIDLLSRIFKQIKGEKETNIPSSESELVKELHDFMKDKQCLVVLDDVWKKEAWDDIYPIFPRTNKVRCRVILTTRIEEIPLYADNKCIIHEPQLLHEDQKWALFSKVAMEGRPQIEKNVDQYEKLGRQMLAKCQGLPLAVVTLAGILRTKRELYEWEEISKDNILKGKGGHNYGVVEDMLELSYLDLPTYLKPCFLYLAIFPEDYDIQAHWLIRMWVAEGFVTSDLLGKGQGTTLEDVAMRLLNELAQRCVLQVTSRNERGQIEKFRLHDLMRELCLNKAEEYQFVGTVSSTNADVRGSSQPRRLSVFSRKNFPTENQSLRTIIDFDITAESSDEAIVRSLEHLGRCKLLRVLNIRDGALPRLIGKLIHLRFLALFGTNIIPNLPKSIKNLRNLLYLWYISDEEVEVEGEGEGEVPNDLVCEMSNLRELILPLYLKRGSESFNTSFGLVCLKNLHTLVSGAGKWMMNELPTLSLTVQRIQIYDIRTMEEIEAIYQCPSVVEDRLCTLACHLDTLSILEFDLHKLRHCKTLWSLELYDCPLAGQRMLEFPPNLVKLCLSKSRIKEREYDLMQVLGELCNLKILYLSRDAYYGKTLSCKASDFPQLQELELDGLYSLEEWIMEEGAMARLTKLRINVCMELKRLPQSIRSITSLKELEVTYMSEEFCKRLGYGGSSVGEDSYIIQHIPSVKISTDWW